MAELIGTLAKAKIQLAEFQNEIQIKDSRIRELALYAKLHIRVIWWNLLLIKQLT